MKANQPPNRSGAESLQHHLPEVADMFKAILGNNGRRIQALRLFTRNRACILGELGVIKHTIGKELSDRGLENDDWKDLAIAFLDAAEKVMTMQGTAVNKAIQRYRQTITDKACKLWGVSYR